MTEDDHHLMEGSISLLLGAGFSAPVGFPTACCVNKFVEGFDYGTHCLNMNDGLIKTVEDSSSSISSKGLLFLGKMIDSYKKMSNISFDYEHFYDYLYSSELFEDVLFEYGESEAKCIVREVRKAYGKVIQKSLCIRESIFDADIMRVYPIFLDQLNLWSKNTIVNVHTLNHDPLFESFSSLEDFKGMVSDGFEWKYDPYCSIDGNRKRSPVEQYTAHYTKPIRLYKLHGSLDYAWVYGYNCEDNNGVIKNNNNYSFNNIKYNPNSTYVSFEEPLILTGHESKEKRYANPIYFRQVMTKFETNLQEAEMLVIIGYGGKDDGINERIIKYFDFRNKPVIFINPSTSDFAQQINASHVKKSISEVIHQDFKIQ